MKRFLAAICLLPVASAALSAPVQWSYTSGGNGHYYEYVRAPATWDAANTDAESRTHNGVNGHLLTLTSEAEKNFVSSTITFGVSAWLGAERVGTTNSFAWTAGPEASEVFFDNGSITSAYSSFWFWEPNNAGGNEDKVEMWGNNWNDLGGWHSRGYVVEYSVGREISPVPLPASGLMLLAGLGALVAGRKRRAS